jgi:putative spermidine/putrescine transport system ATP-binding protein/putrescine transport system ATP-binding protein
MARETAVTEPSKIVELREVTKRFGEFAVDRISFEVRRGQIVSLLGPSGCGKTTILRLIAGFETPDAGCVLISGHDVRGKRPYERNVGLLFQDYALFPHMTVRENVAFGMRHRGFTKREIPERTAQKLELVRLAHLADRRPGQLSGGEQQRVALARALATDPAVMLLDEPLSALDAKLRQELGAELKKILNAAGSTTIVVTHDQEEAMWLAEYVIVMNGGRIMQQGTPTEIYARPQGKFVADFIGRSNWFVGRLGSEITAGFRHFETSDGLELIVPASSDMGAPPYEVCVRPERVAVDHDSTRTSLEPGDNVLSGRVADAADLGADIHLYVELATGQRIAVIEKNLGRPPRRVGEALSVRFNARDCIIVPAAERSGR